MKISNWSKDGGNYEYIMSRKKKNTTGIPDFEIDSLARALLPAIQAYFETEEGQREFALWQAERQKSQLNNKSNKKESFWTARDCRWKNGGTVIRSPEDKTENDII